MPVNIARADGIRDDREFVERKRFGRKRDQKFAGFGRLHGALDRVVGHMGYGEGIRAERQIEKRKASISIRLSRNRGIVDANTRICDRFLGLCINDPPTSCAAQSGVCKHRKKMTYLIKKSPPSGPPIPSASPVRASPLRRSARAFSLVLNHWIRTTDRVFGSI